MKKWLLALVLALVPTVGFSQTVTRGGSVSIQVGTSLPLACAVGDLFFKSDATAGQNIYECSSLNTWTQQLNNGTGSGTGDTSTNTSTSVDSELVLFSGALGKTLKRASCTGIGKVASGVLSCVAAPTGTIAGLSDAQAFTNKTYEGMTFTGSAITVAFGSTGGTVPYIGNTNTWTGRNDFGGAASTAPMKTGTATPGTCVLGDLFFKTNATAGQAIYECSATNTWTQQLNSGASSGDFSSNTSSSVDSEVMLFSGTAGKTGKRASSTGWAKLTSGVLSAITPGTNVETFVTTPTVANFSAVLGNMSANLFYMGPCSGGAAAATFRLICANDFPTDLSETALTSGTTISTYGSSYQVSCAADCTIALPTVTSNIGKTIAFCVNDDSAGLVTLDANGTQTINGSLTRILQVGECAEMVIRADATHAGGEWKKINGNKIAMQVTAERASTDSAAFVAATAANVVMDAKVSGPAAMWDGTGGHVKAVRPGQYQVIISAFFKSVPANDQLNVGPSVNGGNALFAASTFTGAAGFPFISATYPDITLAVGDTVDIQVYDAVGGSVANGSGALPMFITLRERDPW